jgi:hypothetical protein
MPGMPPALRELMLRYCQLGRLLPSETEVMTESDARSRAQVVLAEMAEVKKRIGCFLAAACTRPPE